MVQVIAQVSHATGAALEWGGWITIIGMVGTAIVTAISVTARLTRIMAQVEQSRSSIEELYGLQDEAAKISLNTTRNLDKVSDRVDNLITLLENGVLPNRKTNR